jgi:CMP-2-keto-3-deoxyoctulosonic acid synthetase
MPASSDPSLCFEAFVRLHRGVGVEYRPIGGLPVVRKVFKRRIRREQDGLNVAADIDAVVSVNTGESGQTSVTRSRSRSRIVQRSGSEKPANGTKDPRNRQPEEGGE